MNEVPEYLTPELMRKVEEDIGNFDLCNCQKRCYICGALHDPEEMNWYVNEFNTETLCRDCEGLKVVWEEI